MDTPHLLSSSASIEELTVYLETSTNGVPREEFATGRKGYGTLHKELRERDLKIFRDDKGVAWLFRNTTRTLLRHKVTRELLLETRRTYENGDVEINDFDNDANKRYSTSETNKIGEPPKTCATRGFWEELRIKPGTVREHKLIYAGHTVDQHPSSVYKGLMVHQETTWFKTETVMLVRVDPISFQRDNGVLVEYDWFERDWYDTWKIRNQIMYATLPQEGLPDL